MMFSLPVLVVPQATKKVSDMTDPSPLLVAQKLGGSNMAVCQNLVPLVNIKIAGKWMFIPLKMVLIGIDPYPYLDQRPNIQQVRVSQ